MTTAQIDETFFAPAEGKLSWKHFLHLILLLLISATLSVSAVLYSLGYQVNWSTGSVRQTGIVSLGGNLDGVSISVDGKRVATTLPYWFNRAFPGQYSMEIRKTGYQNWQRYVTVDPNQVTSFPKIILLYSTPVPQEVTDSDLAALSSWQPDRHGIEVRGGDELWINDKLVTRLSQDIKYAQWYPDGVHLVYLTGNELWLTESDGLNAQKITTLSDPQHLRLAFQDSGRRAVIGDGDTVKVLELY